MIELYNATKPSYYFRFNQVKASHPLYPMNSVCAVVSTVTKMYGEFNRENLEKVINMAEARSLQNHDMTIAERAKKKTDDYFMKIQKQHALGLDIIEDYEDEVLDNFGFYFVNSVNPIHAEKGKK